MKAVASPCKATLPGEAILTSPIAKRKAFKAKSKASQPKRANFQSPRVSVMYRLGPVNTDLRDYLSNKRKLRSDEPAHISLSQCGQERCQLVTVHSIHCWLGTIPQLLLQTSNRYSTGCQPELSRSPSPGGRGQQR